MTYYANPPSYICLLSPWNCIGQTPHVPGAANIYTLASLANIQGFKLQIDVFLQLSKLFFVLNTIFKMIWRTKNKLLVRILMVLLSIFFQSAFIGTEKSVIFLLKVSLWQKWGAEEQGGGLSSSLGCDAQKHFQCCASAPGMWQVQLQRDSAPLCLG